MVNPLGTSIRRFLPFAVLDLEDLGIRRRVTLVATLTFASILAFRSGRKGLGLGIGALVGMGALAYRRFRRQPNPFPNGTVATFGCFPDENDLRSFYRYSESLELQVSHRIERGKAAQHLFEFLDDPKQYLILSYGMMDGSYVTLPPLIRECACVNSGNFNRFMTDRRTQLETSLLQNVVTNFPPESSEIRYLGFGAGELLQDFINVGNLMRAGYKKIEVVLVDPALKLVANDDEMRDQDQFEFLFAVAHELGIKFSVEYHHSYRNTSGKFHIIAAIDHDYFLSTAFEDSVAVHSLLKPNGRYYLAFDRYDLIFDHIGCQKVNCGYKPIEKEVLDPDQRELTLEFSNKHPSAYHWILRFRAYASQVSKLHLTMPRPHKKNYLGVPTGEPDLQMSLESMTLFFRLLAPHLDEFTLSFCEDTN
ncbi:MAG: hypothetical protein S4CHLAM81_02120 [Chlamydiales bacterium]|nr:hypothetical protein [Chlamydiales bacterium]MCH9635005.1 hypothetical protein [Chlamydiales bacterium]MCH9703727.1 hypothetical protein [Chlamydiota bacterium]